ncbi:MAG: transglutaminase domain-containing protein [Kofleriaceae bacterium]|nr:transglutaminase domain-containing protein [Kofleriaceae bacterium]
MRSVAVRALAGAMALVVVAAGCGGKKSDGGGAGASGGGGGSAASPAVAGAGANAAPDAGAGGAGAGAPTGPSVGPPAATLALPAGADAAAITVVVRPPDEARPSVAGMRPALDAHAQTLRVIELGPDGTVLPGPGRLTVAIAAADLPAGRTLADVHAVSVAADGTVEDLPIVAVTSDGVQVEVRHFSLVMLVAAITGIALLGTMAMIMRGATEPMMRRDCARWLEPDAARVKALVADPRTFAVDPAAGAITLDLGKPLRGKDVDQGAHALRVEQVIARGEGDCVNMSTLFGSLLLAKGYPVRTVAGTATYRRGGKTYKGLHQWVEVVIDGKGYYVDAFEPAQTRLVPLADATSELSLERNRMCGKDPDGTTVGPVAYDPTWIEAFGQRDVEALRAHLDALKAQHRRLNDECIAGKRPAACDERRAVYEQAKALQEQLGAAASP